MILQLPTYNFFTLDVPLLGSNEKKLGSCHIKDLTADCCRYYCWCHVTTLYYTPSVQSFYIYVTFVTKRPSAMWSFIM